MPNLKEVRNRITSVHSTMQITSAMKMVSAAKLKKAQDNIVRLRPYAEKMTEILSSLSSTLNPEDGVFTQERKGKKVLLVLITSNRGLCGAFNANVTKRAKDLIANNPEGNEYSIVTIGKKAFDAFKKSPNLLSKALPVENNAIYDNISYNFIGQFAEVIMEAYQNKSFDKVVLIYNRFKNAATQELMVENFLPVQPKKGVKVNQTEYLFQPSKEEILEDLIPKSLKTQLFKAVLDSNASEHGARMTAMHKATDNAKEMLSALKLSYNKARQAAITTEILEIVGGANALDDA